MHSSKNTIVAILLLGVSYGVYQVMTAPTAPLVPNSNISVEASAKEGTLNSTINPNSKLDATPAVNPRKAAIDLNDFAAKPRIPSGIDSELNSEPKFDTAKLQAPLLPADYSFSAPPKPDAATTPNNFVSSNQFSSSAPALPSSSFEPSGTMAPLARNSDTNSFSSSPSDELKVSGQTQPKDLYTNLRGSTKDPVANAAPTIPLADTWVTVKAHVATGKPVDALRALTPYCQAPNMSDTDRQDVLNWLDALAKKVIYSNEHHLASVPYVVKANDSLDTLAASWHVPVQLIYNVNKNKITDPLVLPVGAELKQISGPFDAVLDLTNHELTLMLDGMYAARFEIKQVGEQVTTGQFAVTQKSAKDATGGDQAIQLDSGAVLHAENSGTSTSGIAFGRQEAQDLYGILSVGSRITIRR